VNLARFCLVLAFVALLAGSLASREEKAELPAGSTPEQVHARLGQPGHVSRQIVADRCVEQWHYGPPHNLRVVFECPRGETPRLAQVRPARPAGRRE
jgi:hypothetical protein